MHEGLLIISESDKEALYCNKMAAKLVVNAAKSSHVPNRPSKGSIQLLTPQIFKPIRFAGRQIVPVGKNETDFYCLQQIIDK